MIELISERKPFLPLGFLIALFVLVALLGVGSYLLTQYNGMQVNTISVAGDISARQRNEIFGYLSNRTFQNQSIDSLKLELQAISWIKHVSVERKWPDGIAIFVEEQRPIALWNDDAFINDQGEIFFSLYGPDKQLAQLYGPVGSQRQVMQQYQQLNNALLKSGQSIDVLTLDERRSWVLKNNSGIEVLLGRDELTERIQRLLIVAEHISLADRFDPIRSIDTRYSNGVAVSWMQASAGTGGIEGIKLAKTSKSQREFKL